MKFLRSLWFSTGDVLFKNPLRSTQTKDEKPLKGPSLKAISVLL